MTEQADNLNECPSPADLSAWADKQLNDPAIEAHVATCASCKSVLKTYERIDEEIQDNLKRPTQRDMGILVRIKDESMKEISTNKPSLLGPNSLFRLAACVVLIGGLFAMIRYFQNRTRKPSPEIRVAKVDVQQTAVQSITPEDQVYLETAVKNAEAFNDTQLIAWGTDREQLQPLVGQERIKEIPAKQSTMQTWIVGDPSQPVLFLKNLLGPDYRESLEQLITESADQGVVVLVISPEKLQKLAGLLEQLRFKLHKSESRLQETGQMTRCELTFIREK